MSLLLKSELRLRIGARHCAAEVWRAGLFSRCVARAYAQDEPHDVVEAALASLQARGTAMPARAVVAVEDELLYFASVPATGAMKTALATARENFSAALGEHELLVGVTLAASGQRWLASALPGELLEQWRLTLISRDIAVHAVQPALLQDMRVLGTKAVIAPGLVVMVRTEGLSFLTVEKGGVTNLGWERCDLADLTAISARVQAQLAQLRATQEMPDDLRPAVMLVPLNETQAVALRPLAEARSWRLSAPVLLSAEQQP